MTVETPIHEVVREALPDARPPELAVTDLGGEGIEIVYTSPRRICAMLRGLVEGTGRVYDEELELEQLECMHHGAPACRFRVSVKTEAWTSSSNWIWISRATRRDTSATARRQWFLTMW